MTIAPQCLPGGHSHHGHTPAFQWPDDTYLQWGAFGIVLKRQDPISAVQNLAEAIAGKESAVPAALDALKGSYGTAFFEAFPKNPDTFIRGEGKTVAEAEKHAFDQFAAIASCPGHRFERRHYRNGAGICANCGLFQPDVFEPLERCTRCGKATYHGQDATGAFWCDACYLTMPEDIWPEWKKVMHNRHSTRKDTPC